MWYYRNTDKTLIYVHTWITLALHQKKKQLFCPMCSRCFPKSILSLSLQVKAVCIWFSLGWCGGDGVPCFQFHYVSHPWLQTTHPVMTVGQDISKAIPNVHRGVLEMIVHLEVKHI